jgi:uncharacterized protein
MHSATGNGAAVVTGASSGIGEALARRLARRGYPLVLVARSDDRLRALADELGPNAYPLTADLSSRADRAALPGRIAELGLVADLLVNNAGVGTSGPIAASDPDAELKLVEIDVAAVVDLCSRLVPGMVARGRGAVLNVASVGAFGPLPGQASYAAAKAFVLSYTHALREEVRGAGVTAAVLCPGPVHTDFGDKAGVPKADAEKALPRALWATADEVADAALAGLDADRAVIVPGVFNRLGAAAYHLTPRRLLLPVLSRSHPGLRRR